MVTMLSESILFHGPSLDIFEVDEATARIVRAKEERGTLQEKEERELERILSCLEKQSTKVPLKPNPENPSRVLGRLTLVLTNECNYGCRYCYEDFHGEGKLAAAGRRSIDRDTLLRALDTYLAYYDAVQVIMFFGGEPLLRPDLIEEACEHVSQLHAEGRIAHMPRFGIITNGSRYDERIRDLFARYGFQVTVSLDGPAAVNDAYRVFRNGSGTFTTTHAALKKMIADGLQPMIETSVTPAHRKLDCSIHDLAVFLKDEYGCREPHIVPMQVSKHDSNQWTADDLSWLGESFRAFIERNLSSIENGRFEDIALSGCFTDTLYSLIRRTKKLAVCPAGYEAAIAPDGTFYPCFMLINGGEEFKLSDSGTIDERYFRKLSSVLEKNTKAGNDECRSCWCAHICHGCIGANYNASGDAGSPERVNCMVTKIVVKTMVCRLAEMRRDEERWGVFIENCRRYRTYLGETVAVC